MKYIVSMTSFGKRLKVESPLTIQSILQNSVLPDRICIVISIYDKDKVPKEFLNNPLIEIIYTEQDYKSHNKYYYTMLKYPEDVIITIDDDIIYPKSFVEYCINSYLCNPNVINACRVHKIKYKDGVLLPYKQWEWESKEEEASYDLFFTGVGGVVYPPNILRIDSLDINMIYDYIRVDDILLNYLCRVHKVKIKRIPIKEEYKDIHKITNKPMLSRLNVSLYNDIYLNKIGFNDLNNKNMEVKEIKKKEENPLNKILENVKKDNQVKPVFNMQEMIERFRQKIKER